MHILWSIHEQGLKAGTWTCFCQAGSSRAGRYQSDMHWLTVDSILQVYWP